MSSSGLEAAQNMTCILSGESGAPKQIHSRTLRDEDSGRFSVAECAFCGHAQITPLPSEEEEAAYYAADMQPKALWKNGEQYEAMRERSGMDTDRRLAWLESEMPREKCRSVLDVGSGYGFFVKRLIEEGYNARGLEVSTDRLELARADVGDVFFENMVDKDFVTQHEGEFDAVTSFHVIEHLRDPIAYLAQILRLVAPGGKLLVEVPNLTDEIMYYIPNYGNHLWQIGHLNYFDQAHLETALRKAGAKDVTVSGVQRYGLRHLVTWTDRHGPDLGKKDPEGTNPLFERIEALYREDRITKGTCDTVIATVSVP